MVASLLGRWARWRRGSLASPLAFACTFFFFLYPYLLALAGFVGPLRVRVYLLLFVCPTGLWYVCLWCRWCALRRRVVPSFWFRAGVPHAMLLSVRAA